MTSTDLTVQTAGSYLALNHGGEEAKEIITELLGGQDLTERDLPRVKMPSGGSTTWEVPSLGGTEPAKELTGILVHFKFVRGYWPAEERTGTPPTCSAEGPERTAVGTGDPGGPCITCPYNAYGSDPKAGRGKACKERELWFLLQPESFLPLVVALSPMSLRAAADYRIKTLGAAMMRPTNVVTGIKLEADKNPEGDAFARAVPRVVARLEPEEAQAAREYAMQFRPDFDRAAEAMAAEGSDLGNTEPGDDSDLAEAA